ncbi:HNH endonuclease signature motif containing protein, partial [Pseudomonas aeruginosa]|uniref:HNH endonuclease signature motif containing protein n=1 Tax=Pseudomonas aeruginosa TaxID=287 RepID=UPI0031B6C85F
LHPPSCRRPTAFSASRGLVVPATDIDHIINGEGDYSDDNSRANLQPLCHECHSLKTARDQGKSVTLGCDVSGQLVLVIAAITATCSTHNSSLA